MAPSRRMVSPLSIGLSMMCLARRANSVGWPSRAGCGIWAASLADDHRLAVADHLGMRGEETGRQVLKTPSCERSVASAAKILPTPSMSVRPSRSRTARPDPRG